MTPPRTAPAVMVFAGLDPTGGAGLQADIEAIASHGCHACPVLTAVAVQNTRDVRQVIALDGEVVDTQARTVLADVPIAAFKIGLLGSVEALEVVVGILRAHPTAPVVFDPVLRAGGGTPLADAQMVRAMEALLPLTTVLTPNAAEARALVPHAAGVDACGLALLRQGSEFVLITGADEATPEVTNTLYGQGRVVERFAWARLEGKFHGSGCTLASSIAGLLAQGDEPAGAILEAQEYTWEALRRGYRIGAGQWIPNRLFWARRDD